MKKLRFTIRILFVCLIFAGTNCQLFAQEELMNNFEDHFDVKDDKISYKDYTTNTNEAKQLASAMFLFYKEFISSQDIDVCVFTPSCSVYAMESIKEQGLAEGLISAFDRMSRCHSLAAGYYDIHPHTHKFYDPIEPKR